MTFEQIKKNKVTAESIAIGDYIYIVNPGQTKASNKKITCNLPKDKFYKVDKVNDKSVSLTDLINGSKWTMQKREWHCNDKYIDVYVISEKDEIDRQISQLKLTPINQVYYGDLQVDTREKDVVIIAMFEKSETNLIQIERHNIARLIEVLTRELPIK